MASAFTAGKPSRTSGVVVGDADALAAAAGGGLDHHRIADLARDAHRLLHVGDLAGPARHGGDARPRGEQLGLDLVAHGVDRLGVGADEHDPLGRAAPGEVGAFGEEAEAGVDRLRPRRLGGRDDLVGDEIALRGGRGADRHRLVGHLHRQRARVRLRVDHHRGDPHPAAGLDDPHRDLAAVGDQDLGEHRGLRPPPAARARASPAKRLAGGLRLCKPQDGRAHPGGGAERFRPRPPRRRPGRGRCASSPQAPERGDPPAGPSASAAWRRPPRSTRPRAPRPARRRSPAGRARPG